MFGDTPQPVFPLPLAFTLDSAGFGFGLPQVVTTADHVVGSHQEDISVSLAGVADQVVSSYDDASFTLSSRDGAGHVPAGERVQDGDDRCTRPEPPEAAGGGEADVRIAVVQRHEQDRLRLVAAHVAERGGRFGAPVGKRMGDAAQRTADRSGRFEVVGDRAARLAGKRRRELGEHRRQRSVVGVLALLDLVAVEEGMQDGLGAMAGGELLTQPVLGVDPAPAQEQRGEKPDRNEGDGCKEGGRHAVASSTRDELGRHHPFAVSGDPPDGVRRTAEAWSACSTIFRWVTRSTSSNRLP